MRLFLLLIVSVACAFPAAGPFSTFLQANGFIESLGHDAAGNIYVLGTVLDSPIPGHSGDLFTARLNPSATKIAYYE